jgi:HD-like signal output (HDOD) protein
MTDINLNELEIPKASAHAARALVIVTSAEPDMHELEQAIMQDPLLAGSLLRFANSPLYRRSSEITNVRIALNLLGLNSVRSAVVTANMRSMLPVENRIGQLLLTHMTDIAMLCRMISAQCCPKVSDDLEFLGLVHDVGMLTLAANFEDAYDKIVAQAINEGRVIDELEKKAFGLSHDAVTARTAETFRLPRRHIDLVAGFHERALLQTIEADNDRDICVLALAHCIHREVHETGETAEEMFSETIPENTEQLAALLAITAEQLDHLRNEAAALITAERQLA